MTRKSEVFCPVIDKKAFITGCARGLCTLQSALPEIPLGQPISEEKLLALIQYGFCGLLDVPSNGMDLQFSNLDSTTSVNDPARETEFLRLLAISYRELYAAAMSVVGNRNDADDVIQEVCVVLWARYDEFDPTTNFHKWACTVAFNVARTYARKRNRRRGVGLSEEALSKIVRMRTASSELLELRREILRNCLTRLAPRDRHFLTDCYRTSSSLVDYAQNKGLTVSTVYSKLKRLRRTLVDCVQKKFEQRGHDAD